jgi:hypothetical protein
MPILDTWELNIHTDDVLRAQGAAPEVMRSRRPQLINKTDEAILRGQSLLHPLVLYEKYEVIGLTHDRLNLSPRDSIQGKYFLSGQLIAEHLAQAQEIIVMVCTIGTSWMMRFRVYSK